MALVESMDENREWTRTIVEKAFVATPPK